MASQGRIFLYENDIIAHPLELGRSLKAGRAASDYKYIVFHILLFQTCTWGRSTEILPVLSEILLCRIIFHAHLVQERFDSYLVGLEAEIPWIIPHHKACYFLVRKSRDAVTVLTIGLASRFGDHVLPPVKEIWTTGTIGNDKVRLERFHAFELLVGVGQRISPVPFDEILPEPEAAAMASFRIIHDLSTPGLDHSDKDVWIFSTAYSFGRKHL